MLSLFGKPTSSTEQPSQLFSGDDLKEIFESFSLEDAGFGDQLVITREAVDLVNKTQLSDSIRKDIRNSINDRLSTSSLADQYHVQEHVIRDVLLPHSDWAFESADGESILTARAQNTLLEMITAKTKDKFEITTKLLDGITLSVLLNLLKSRESSSQVLLYGDQHGSPVLQEAGVEIYSAALFKDVKGKIDTFIQNCQHTSKPASWPASAYFGLSMSKFFDFMKEVTNKSRIFANDGLLVMDDGSILFTPSEYLAKERNQILSRVAEGELQYLGMSTLIGGLPSQFRDMPSVEQAISTRHSTKQLFVAKNILISRTWIVLQTLEAIAAAPAQSPVSLENVISSFPTTITEDVSRVINTCIGEHANVKRAGNYVVSNFWIDGIALRTRELATNLATSIWNIQDVSRPRAAIVESKLKDGLVEDEKIEKSLVDSLWVAYTPLAESALRTYEHQLDELDTASDEQFKALWSSRIVSKVQLYATGLMQIEDKTLSDQLSDILRSHITLELVPQAAKRAKTRGLLSSPKRKLSSRLVKLQTALSAKTQLSLAIEELEKFQKHLEISQLDDVQLGVEKSNYAKEMAKTMTADEDGARLFLCLQIVLFSSFNPGVVYASGKFAPKLFKLVKPKLTAEEVKWMDETKDCIKAGNTPDNLKLKMRSLAFDVSTLI